jgi:hypothetical protein
MRCKHCTGEREPTEEERKTYELGTMKDYLNELNNDYDEGR